MPLYRLSAPGLPVEVVVRRCAPDVLVERLHEPVPETSRAAWLI